VSKIAIPPTARRAAARSMRPADMTAANRRRTAAFPCSFRFGFTPGRVVGALHGVDAHFVFSTRPTPNGYDITASLHDDVPQAKAGPRSAFHEAPAPQAGRDS